MALLPAHSCFAVRWVTASRFVAINWQPGSSFTQSCAYLRVPQMILALPTSFSSFIVVFESGSEGAFGDSLYFVVVDPTVKANDNGADVVIDFHTLPNGDQARKVGREREGGEEREREKGCWC